MKGLPTSHRVAISCTLVLAITLTVVFVCLHELLRRDATRELDSGLQRQADAVAAMLQGRDSLAPADLQRAISLDSLQRFSAQPPLTVVRDTDGHVLASSFPLGTSDPLLLKDDIPEVLAGKERLRTVSVPDGDSIRVLSRRVEEKDGQRLGYVQVAGRLDPVTGSSDRVEVIFVIAGAIALITGGLMIVGLVRAATAPLGQLVRFAQQAPHETAGRRLELHGPPDVEALAASLNAMIERFEDSLRQRRDFMMSVSHDLRTPLTALSGTIDVLLLDEKLAPETVARLRTMSGGCRRLIRLCQNVLSLEQVALGQALNLQPLALDEVVLEVVRECRGLPGGERVTTAVEAQLEVHADGDRLRQALLNLVENGIVHGAGRVTVRLRAAAGDAVLEVEDDGPGVLPEDAARIFDRHYRGKHRSRGGTGLGLAIVRRVAEAHGGRAVVTGRDGRLNCFQVRLPLAAAPADAEEDLAGSAAMAPAAGG